VARLRGVVAAVTNKHYGAGRIVSVAPGSTEVSSDEMDCALPNLVRGRSSLRPVWHRQESQPPGRAGLVDMGKAVVHAR